MNGIMSGQLGSSLPSKTMPVSCYHSHAAIRDFYFFYSTWRLMVPSVFKPFFISILYVVEGRHWIYFCKCSFMQQWVIFQTIPIVRYGRHNGHGPICMQIYFLRALRDLHIRRWIGEWMRIAKAATAYGMKITRQLCTPTFANGHTTLKAPVLVRSPKLGNVGRG